MIAPGRIFAVTLAAGLSRRFDGDKLAATLDGGTVLDASLAALDGPGWLDRAAVVTEERPSGWTHPYRAIVNDRPERGMGHSLALGAGAAEAAGADFLLVTLGDMPRVRPASLQRLIGQCPDRPDALAALVVPGQLPGPPALFGRGWFAGLAAATGDKGARAILRDPAAGLVPVDLPPDEAADVDSRDDLARLRSGE